MALFEVYYVLLLITFGRQFIGVTGVDDFIEDDEAVTKNAMIKKLNWLQSLNRGHFAKPKIEKEFISTMSLKVLNDSVHEAYVELHCSYVHFALVYLDLMKTYINKPNMSLTEELLNAMIFRDESATILVLLHGDLDERWNAYRTVMWLFHMFSEKIARFLESNNSSSKDTNTVYVSVIRPYEAINILLNNLSRTIGCEAFDQAQEYLKVMYTKLTFWNQVETNIQVSFIPCQCDDFFVDNLLVCNSLENLEELMITLENTFAVQLDWQTITRMLDDYYGQAKNAILMASMQEYMQTIEMFQIQFMRVLKAIAMRIVIMHLLQVKNIMMALLGGVWHHYIASYVAQHERVTNSFKAFVDCVHLEDDQHLAAVLSLMNTPFENIQTPEQIITLAVNIHALLQDMSQPNNAYGVRFEVLMKDDDEIFKQATGAAVKFATDKAISNSKDLLVIEIYVEFVKTIANFKVIHWFSQLSITDELVQFEVLEERGTTAKT